MGKWHSACCDFKANSSTQASWVHRSVSLRTNVGMHAVVLTYTGCRSSSLVTIGNLARPGQYLGQSIDSSMPVIILTITSSKSLYTIVEWWISVLHSKKAFRQPTSSPVGAFLYISGVFWENNTEILTEAKVGKYLLLFCAQISVTSSSGKELFLNTLVGKCQGLTFRL